MNDEQKKGPKLLELQPDVIGTDFCSDNVCLQFQQCKFAKNVTNIYAYKQVTGRTTADDRENFHGGKRTLAI